MEPSLTSQSKAIERVEEAKAETLEGREKKIAELRADQMRHIQQVLMYEPEVKDMQWAREELQKFRTRIEYVGQKQWCLDEYDATTPK